MIKTIIRPAEMEDYRAICALCEVVDALHRQRLPHLFRQPQGPARERTFVQDLLESEEAGFFIAQAGQQAAGFVIVLLKRSPDIPSFVPRCYAVVDSLVVAEAFQRQGLGQALMAQAEAWARQRGASEVELSVYAFNQAARELYQALGYQVVSLRMGKDLSSDEIKT